MLTPNSEKRNMGGSDKGKKPKRIPKGKVPKKKLKKTYQCI